MSLCVQAKNSCLYKEQESMLGRDDHFCDIRFSGQCCSYFV